MAEFDLDRALSGEETGQPRLDWMAEACDEYPDPHQYRYRREDPDEDPNEETGWELPYAAFSDYSGSTCEMANVRSFKEMFKDAIKIECGAYSSQRAWVSKAAIMAMTEETWESLKETIEDLEGYPVIDDSVVSEVEQELEEAAWDDWLKDDFKKELLNHFSEEIEAYLEANPRYGDFDDFGEMLDAHLFELFRATEPEYQHETGGNVHVSFNHCFRGTAFSDVLDVLSPEDPRQLKLDLQTEGLVDKLLETDGPHSYSSTQINLPEELAQELLAWSKANISEEDLFVDEDGGLGRETEMHTTVKYGLTAAEPSAELLAILAATEPFEVRLGSISLFTTNEDYDVVKLTVDSPGLRELNRQVAAACPNEDTYPEYDPHATLAYVKKGRGTQFEGVSPWESKGKMGQVPEDAGVFTADSLVFSPSTDTGKLTLPFGEAARA